MDSDCSAYLFPGRWRTPNGFLQLVRGHIVGSTGNGGANRNGAVFSLNPPTSPGGPWIEQVLHSFLGSVDGSFPRSVIADATGALYGSTNGGGSGLGGTVWKLTQPAGSGPWMLTTVRAFTAGTDGGNPLGIVLGNDGNIYGVTSFEGDPICRCGTVFQLVPPLGGTGPWTLNTLYTFHGGSDGGVPSNLVVDGSGTIYGIARTGGLACIPVQDDGCGVVFTVTPPLHPGRQLDRKCALSVWSEWQWQPGRQSSNGKPLFLNGNIYGLTLAGGQGGGSGEGTVFEIVP